MITAPAEVRRARSEVAVDEREQRLLPDEEKVARADYGYVNTGIAGRARGVRRVGDGRFDAMRRLARDRGARSSSSPASAVYVVESSPPWFERIRYPLHYTAIVRERARAEGIDPALLAAVIYQESKFRPNARSSSGAIGLMQLTPSTAKGIALRTGGTSFKVSDLPTRRSTSATAAGTSTTCSPSTARCASCSPPTTRGRGTSTAGAARGRGSSSPRRAPTSSRVEHLQHVYGEAWHAQLYPQA